MDKIFSTAGVHPRDRYAFWHEVACREIVGHQSRPSSFTAFEADIEAAPLADLAVLIFQSSPLNVVRTRQNIARASTDDLFICNQLAGRAQLEQHGREVLLTPGVFCLLDPMKPYAGQFCTGSKMLILKADRRAIESRVGDPSLITSITLAKGAVGTLTARYLGTLPFCTKVPKAQAAVIGEQALDLVGMSTLAVLAKHGAKPSTRRSMAVLRIRTAIAERLTDPAVNPSSVASAAGMSVRNANLLLADHGTTIGRLILKLRLDRCQRVLEDPSQAHRTVTEIAFGMGFSDLSHFSRSFKKSFGVSPSEYRYLRLRELAASEV